MESNISGWIDITQDIIDESTQESINGVSVNLILSPLEAPLAIRGDYEESSKLFVIRFKYARREELKPEKVGSHITFFVGAKSNKIFRIEIDVHALDASSVDLNLLHNVEEDVNQALNSYIQRHKEDNGDTLGIASKVIRKHSNDIYQELALGH